MTRERKGDLYPPSKKKEGWRIDNWDEDSKGEDPKKTKKRKKKEQKFSKRFVINRVTGERKEM